MLTVSRKLRRCETAFASNTQTDFTCCGHPEMPLPIPFIIVEFVSMDVQVSTAVWQQYPEEARKETGVNRQRTHRIFALEAAKPMSTPLSGARMSLMAHIEHTSELGSFETVGYFWMCILFDLSIGARHEMFPPRQANRWRW